ncbi:hypothetical protein ACJQWK_00097 [Exserohilum turcicum]
MMVWPLAVLERGNLCMELHPNSCVSYRPSSSQWNCTHYLYMYSRCWGGGTSNGLHWLVGKAPPPTCLMVDVTPHTGLPQTPNTPGIYQQPPPPCRLSAEQDALLHRALSRHESSKPALVAGAALVSLVVARPLHHSRIPFLVFDREASILCRAHGYRLRL